MKRTWKFNNKTNWQSAQIRAIVRRAAKQTWNDVKNGPVKVIVEVCNTRSDISVSVIKDFLTGVITLKLPEDDDPIDKAKLACHASWACGYLRGLTVRDMKGLARYDERCDYKTCYAWTEEYALAKKPVKTKPTGAGLAFKKAEEAQEKVNQWETKVKKATTMLKKWKRRLKYHESRGLKLQQEWARKLQERS